MAIKIVRKIDSRQVMIECDNKYYVVSESLPGWVPVETLVFPCDENGEITNWIEVAGEIGVRLDSYLRSLLDRETLECPWGKEQYNPPF